jgi:FdhD protein
MTEQGTGIGASSSRGDEEARFSEPSVPQPGGDADRDLMRSIRITRLTSSGRESCEDSVVREDRFDLYLNGRHLVALVCLPYDLDAFIVGFLINEGILDDPHALEFAVNEEEGRIDARGPFAEEAVNDFLSKKTLTSGCGSGVTGRDLNQPARCLKVDADFRIHRDTISDFMRVLRDEASLYQLTGGAHIAALADEQGKLLLTAQDIGRHTAVDKVIGKAFLSGIDHERCVLFSSGRLSSEITAKAIHARTPVLVSRAAPTSLSVRLARRFLLTLIGFARGRRMNVYSVPERIVD